jgi:hypothetical protein
MLHSKTPLAAFNVIAPSELRKATICIGCASAGSILGFLFAAISDPGRSEAYLGHRNIQHTVRYTELSSARFKSAVSEMRLSLHDLPQSSSASRFTAKPVRWQFDRRGSARMCTH